mgnify:CR=1 FL=1
MSATTVPPSKTMLRRRFRQYRRRLSASEYDAKSQTITERALRVPAIQHASTLHVYWPQRKEGEVDTRPLIDTLDGAGYDLVLPVVTAFPPDPPAMEHRRYITSDALRPNRWGIPEPVDAPSVSPHDLDAVIVPALGAGRDGHRIGHGTGYYDAFLASLSAPRIVLTYDATVVDAIPADAHDVPATAIVTETGVIRP